MANITTRMSKQYGLGKKKKASPKKGKKSAGRKKSTRKY